MANCWDVIVIGAGAAGLVAAARAAEQGASCLLLEKQGKTGVKILISGGTRCNITHDTDRRGMVEAFGEQGAFLQSALAAFPPEAVIQMIEQEGVPTKVEDTGKIFPQSDRAADVAQALTQRAYSRGVEIRLREPVVALRKSGETFSLATPNNTYQARRVIVTSGGRSYPGCGTTGDGYAWCQDLGHTLIPTRPALVPLRIPGGWLHRLSGVTLPDVQLQVIPSPQDETASPKRKSGGRKIRDRHMDRGSLLLTHFGLSGPVAMNVSRYVNDERPGSRLRWNLLPDLSNSQFEDWLSQLSRRQGKRPLVDCLAVRLPKRVVLSLAQSHSLDIQVRVAEFGKTARGKLKQVLTQLEVPITGTLGYEKAEVTRGGISLDEVDSKTMGSKRIPGLFLAGEILDLDGPIGGFNFQAAFSTGWLAGTHAGKNEA